MTSHNAHERATTLEDVVVAGHAGDETTARNGVHDDDPAVRVAALGALHRMTALDADTLRAALADETTLVRARACELAAARPDVDLLELLDDPDPIVVEVAAWATGEQLQRDDPDSELPDVQLSEAGTTPAAQRSIDRLVDLGQSADAPLVREAAIAALGAIGHSHGLDVTLHAAANDRPAVRRRAVVALAAYDDDRVIEVLRAALEDRDWQVRGAAEDLLRAIDIDER